MSAEVSFLPQAHSWQSAWIRHQPSWPRQFHCDRSDNKDKVQESHASAQGFLQLPAANLDAHNRAENHAKEQAGVEHQVGRLDGDTPEVRITRLDPAFHQPRDWQPNLEAGLFGDFAGDSQSCFFLVSETRM